MVITGQWREEESHRKLQERLDEINESIPTRSSYDIGRREERKKVIAMIERRGPNDVEEREYYFDEGLGESLNDHVAKLTRDVPGITIDTRRDRDGLAIVKLTKRP